MGKSVCLMAGHGLSEEELSEFREIFNLVDSDGSGEISREELGELISTLGLKASQEELDRMIDEIDKDGDGTIDFNEFCSVMSHRVSQTYTPEEVKHAFKVQCSKLSTKQHRITTT